MTEGKKAQKLIIFHSANKINNYKWRAEGEKKRKKVKKKKIQRIYRGSHNRRIINVFLESLLSESFPSLGVTVYFTFLVKVKVSQLFLTLCDPMDCI